MKISYLKILLLLTFLKGLLWAGVTPIFQAPDEPLHFAHVQNLAEHYQYQISTNTASRELEKSLGYLEFQKLVFNPSKKQTFSNSLIGPNEKKLNAIKEESSRKISKKLILASENPPLYYFIGSLFYKFSPIKNLIWRIYLIRIYSIVCLVLTVFFSFKIVMLIFGEGGFFPYVISLVVAFFPMLNFIAGSINNDNLFILLITVIFYLIVKDTKKLLDLKQAALLGIIAGAAFLTRQNFIPLFFYLIFIILFNDIMLNKKFNLPRILIFIFGFFLVSGWWIIENTLFREAIAAIPFEPKKISYFSYLERFFYFQQPKKLFNYFWGTFGWVDTRLPRIVYYVLFIFSGSCFLGFLGYFRSLKKSFKKYLWLWESLSLILFFSFSLSYYEWHYYEIHQDFFLQGRYFFPLIVPIMIFLTLGWQNLFPKKWQNKALFVLAVLMITFNFYCLFFIMIPRYYDTCRVAPLRVQPFWTCLVTLTKQLSQYKPEFLKGIAWPILLGIYLTLIGVLIKNLHQLLWKVEEK